MKKTATKDHILKVMQNLAENASDSIGNQFRFELLDAGEETGEYTFRCKTEKWMRNAYGALHGGISSLILDQAMGFVAVGTVWDQGISPTIQMQQYYHKFFVPGETARVAVKIQYISGSLIQMQSEMYSESDNPSLCVSATAIYYILKSK